MMNLDRAIVVKMIDDKTQAMELDVVHVPFDPLLIHDLVTVFKSSALKEQQSIPNMKFYLAMAEKFQAAMDEYQTQRKQKDAPPQPPEEEYEKEA